METKIMKKIITKTRISINKSLKETLSRHHIEWVNKMGMSFIKIEGKVLYKN